MFKKQIFEPIVAYVYVIEFKKWGLQHAHFLIILKTNAKLIAPESFDRVACVELPNKTTHENLYLAVIRHMLHGPCGYLNLNNVCMKKKIGKCRNDYH